MKTGLYLSCAALLFSATSTMADVQISVEPIEFNADNCLAGQDLYAADVDVSNCPEMPALPESALLGETEDSISLGAWELGQTSNGAVYKYGSLQTDETGTTYLSYYGAEDEVAVVDELNIECWAKAYYRLRAILQNPPLDYLTLKEAGFQGRFFQFQTDLRNGPTGYRQISSFRDHLVKWVSVIDEDGVCQQPTLGAFEGYLRNELERRGL